MDTNIKKLFEGKRKFITISAVLIVAILAWPFVIPGLLGLLVHKKVNSARWKYGLLTFLVLIGIGSAPSYYENFANSYVAQPKIIENRTIDGQVKAEVAPTNIPTSTPTTLPTQTPFPTIVPTSKPSPTTVYVPQKVYFSPTNTPTQPQTQTTTESSSGLSNNDYYVNSQGNTVHSPAYSTNNSVPAGASARCGDGTYSYSQSSRGTCSHHGGVAQWL